MKLKPSVKNAQDNASLRDVFVMTILTKGFAFQAEDKNLLIKLFITIFEEYLLEI